MTGILDIYNCWNFVVGTIKHAHYNFDIDLVAGGVPCPPFSHAGKQLGADDERNLFDEAIRVVRECAPKAVMLENGNLINFMVVES